MGFTSAEEIRKHKAIVFSDWDGTITLQDSNDYLTDNIGFGTERRKELNRLVLENKMTFRESFQLMLDSIHTPYPECIDILLKHIDLDPGFAGFYHWAKKENIPIIVLSSGMKPIIKALLSKLIGKEATDDIEIISNDVKYTDPQKKGDTWDIVFHDDSDFGHDKSLAIKPYANVPNHPPLFYCGDGVSDLSAARETDLLFAKEKRDLITFCEREKVPYREFHSFADIHKIVKEIVEGTVEISKVVQNSS